MDSSAERAPTLRPTAPADVFQRAFDASPAVQTLVRLPEGVIVEVNGAFTRLLGYQREEIIGKTPLDLNFWVRPELIQVYRATLDAERRVRDFEVDVRAKDGTVRTVVLSSELVDIDGVTHSLSAGIDITARKRAEAELLVTAERLRQSEERFSKAFRSNPAMVAITRFHDGAFVSVNEAFCRAIGYTEAELVGRSARDINLHVTAEQRERFLQTIAERGFMREFELVVRTKSGALLTLLASGELTDIDGTPHLLTVGLDITARQEADAKLRQSELRLRETEAQFSTAFHASPVLMTIAKLEDGRLIEVNDAFMQVLGLTRAEAIGRTTAELGVWADLQARARFFEQLIRHGSVRNADCHVRRKDGMILTVQLSGEVVEINRVPHLLTFGVDVTRRREAEAEQERALQRERELSQLKTDFVSLVSHEFRTPLEIIMSSVDNLGRYHDRLAPEKRQELLGTINKSVRRMAGMMEEVLFLGRFDSGGTEFRPAPIDLATFCRRVVDEMESATNRMCPIALEFEGALAGAHGDEAVLRHILTNLLSNAVKYSPPGERVVLAIRREGRIGVFRVVDRGCGIPTADQARLFQAFHRGSNVQQIHGTGLGLLIVRRCVELHGGEIAYETAEGRGTTFTVRLPLFEEVA